MVLAVIVTQSYRQKKENDKPYQVRYNIINAFCIIEINPKESHRYE